MGATVSAKLIQSTAAPGTRGTSPNGVDWVQTDSSYLVNINHPGLVSSVDPDVLLLNGTVLISSLGSLPYAAAATHRAFLADSPACASEGAYGPASVAQPVRNGDLRLGWRGVDGWCRPRYR